MTSNEFPKWDYKEYPKTLSKDDLWGQVRRTVYGRPVPEAQIQMMVDAIRAGLHLTPATTLLDIGCGNAALTARLFPHCGQIVGVDSSEFLITVANELFGGFGHEFVCMEAGQYVLEEKAPLRFSAALCFGVFAYLSDHQATQMLSCIFERFSNVRSFFIGSIPDSESASRYFGEAEIPRAQLEHHQSQIGVWRSRGKLSAMATETGWNARIQEYLPEFYQSHYRYNAILERMA